MAIPGITYRLIQGSSLTHTQMDNNFRSVIYSSSIHDDGATLRLHFDTTAADYYTIPLGGSSTGSVAIVNNTNNNILTATGLSGSLQGEPNFSFDGTILRLSGSFYIDDTSENILIGEQAGASISGANKNILIGYQAGENLTGVHNTVVGYQGLDNATDASGSTAVGYGALGIVSSGNNNIGIGKEAGIRLSSGTDNIYIGYQAGPETDTAQSNKLYIHNTGSNTPLVYGDFATGQITFNSQVSASIFSGSFYGDGSNLTGLTVNQGWDGTFSGSAAFTGSLIVSGATTADIVDFTQVSAISGSIFSGSFVGDGSGLTGVQADTFPYTGSAIISGSLSVEGPTSVTGSLVVSGSSPTINLKGVTTVDTNIGIFNKTTTTLSVGYLNYNASLGTPVDSVAIGYCAATNTPTISYRHVVVGSCAGRYAGADLIALGYKAAQTHNGNSSIAIGSYAMSSGVGNGTGNIAVGGYSLCTITNGSANVAVGFQALKNAASNQCNAAVGYRTLENLNTGTITGGNANTGLGACAGYNLKSGHSNIYLGHCAGPSTPNTNENSKLYIASGSGNPLIGGDFSANTVTISGSLLVSQSVTATEYYGDGSNLTGVEWDGSHDGNANITGSFTVSGSSVVVDFTNTLAISGSTFSGSFAGDGSGLTGITTEWDGTLNGNAEITGSLIVSGALDVSSTVTLSSTGFPGGPGIELIHFHSSSLSGTHNIQDFTISATGYTGFKADYSLTNTGEDEKKIGTLLGAWDQSGGTTINDSHTLATGGITGTSFSITSDGSTATLQLDAASGTYEVNMLITAFKRQV